MMEKEGKKQLAKHRKKRGIPADVYVTDRILWNKTISDDLDDSKIIDHATEIKGFKKRCDYIKDFIKKHRSEIRLDANSFGHPNSSKLERQ